MKMPYPEAPVDAVQEKLGVVLESVGPGADIDPGEVFVGTGGAACAGATGSALVTVTAISDTRSGEINL
ncbi:MAG TPA: hypothetical protein PKE29_01480 [Phycisphaerales bacterium]|nr:hypothetical protein [Phycisphaerales bacterium]